MKNKLLAAVLIIALFIPTVVAIVSYSTSDRKTVVSALRLMGELVPAVDPVRAATDLTHIRSRVEIVADKDPAWRPVLETIDGMRGRLIAEYR